MIIAVMLFVATALAEETVLEGDLKPVSTTEVVVGDLVQIRLTHGAAIRCGSETLASGRYKVTGTHAGMVEKQVGIANLVIKQSFAKFGDEGKMERSWVVWMDASGLLVGVQDRRFDLTVSVLDNTRLLVTSKKEPVSVANCTGPVRVQGDGDVLIILPVGFAGQLDAEGDSVTAPEVSGETNEAKVVGSIGEGGSGLVHIRTKGKVTIKQAE